MLESPRHTAKIVLVGVTIFFVAPFIEPAARAETVSSRTKTKTKTTSTTQKVRKTSSKKRARRKSKRARRRVARKFWQRYRVFKGEKLAQIAAILKVSEADLKRWNRLGRKRVKPGRRLKYYGPKRRSESKGRPNKGSLVGGVNLDGDGDNMGIGFALAKRRVATWGTPELIKLLRQCGRVYRGYFSIGKGPSIPIGDLSLRHGGPLRPHVSHQSGRDVDIGFIRKRSIKAGHFTNTKAKQMDMYKQWVLLKCFLDSPKTQKVFMERSLVKAMKAYITKLYNPKGRKRRKRVKKLRKYLAFFSGKKKRVIRPDNAHRSHMHVRIHCAKNDGKCVP
jgi:murein endopeptidase